MVASYLSRASLALELDMSESTVDEMVKRGVLPRPIRLSNGCVRWCWESVKMSLASLDPQGNHAAPVDAYTQGARDAAKFAQERRRGAS